MEVIINGVRYAPVTDSNPNAEHIARGIMEEFWGDLPEGYDWKQEARDLRVSCSDSESIQCPSVLDVVGRIIHRIEKEQP